MSRFSPRKTSPRLKDFPYKGPYAYMIAITTHEKAKYLQDRNLVTSCVDALTRSARGASYQVLAYCFMPNHLHLLVQGNSDDSDLKRFIKTFKQATGFQFKRKQGTSLWHRSYHDHILRQEEDMAGVADYIWGNPVRAGLVESRKQFPYSGPRHLLEDRPEGLSLRSITERREEDRPEGLSVRLTAREANRARAAKRNH